MALSFAGLIETYGLPDLVVRNSTLFGYMSKGMHYRTSSLPELPTPAFRLEYQRTPVGGADFLRIRSQIELRHAEWSELSARRQAAGLDPLPIVEYRRLPRPHVVRISLESDTSPLSLEELINASRELRLLGVYSVRNFDYAAAVFGLISPETATTLYTERFDYGFTFLFPAGASIRSDDVPSDENYDNVDEFWESNRSFFTRPLTVAEAAAMSPVPESRGWP